MIAGEADALGHQIEDERTQAEAVAPAYDKRREDVVFLVLAGPDQGKRFLVKPPGGTIGREPDAVVQTRDQNVSRRAATIEFTKDGKVFLSDSGSRNGIYVNAVRVERAEIFDGNHVQLSTDTILRVRFQDPAETLLLEKLHGANTRDELTGLPNRRYVEQRLAQELSFSRRHKVPVAITLIDIDDMKKVNDADGQQGGDALLRHVSDLVRRNVRIEDVVARYGGDEIVVILRAQTSIQAAKFAARMRTLIRKKPFDVGDVPIRATVTIGVAGFEEGFEVENPIELLDRADVALHRAKDAGKDRVERWSK
jgi:diguanylate cyclase (GGDEF)-like protein